MTAIKLSTVLSILKLVNLSWQTGQIPRVITPLGTITGFYKTISSGRKYEAYMGVPYAQPPLGKLRFEPPRPVEKWEGELPATVASCICLQYPYRLADDDSDRISGCEDCLYINVYVPVLNKTRKSLPVLFCIHGGAFQFGNGNDIPDQNFLNEDLILVTFNYRLGPFGYLSTGDSVVPGNMGQKDQSMALRWVFDHISNFGGDPKQIVLLGSSSGSVAVHYHYLSPLSAGLFKGGVAISGLSLQPWALTYRAPAKARKLGALMGCPTKNMTEMVECLRYCPPRVMMQAVGDFMAWLYIPFSPFGPVIEEPGPNAFLSDTPIEIIRRGEAADVPLLIGTVDKEGLYPTGQFITSDKLLRELNDNWNKLAPYLLYYKDTVPFKWQNVVGKKIREHYLGSKAIDNSTITSLVRMVTERLYHVDYEKTLRIQGRINKSPIWAYYYNYRSTHSLTEELSGGCLEDFGVCHADDIHIAINTVEGYLSPEDERMKEILLEIYLSFGIFGEPKIDSLKWPPSNPNATELQYLRIDNTTSIYMDSTDLYGKDNFWNNFRLSDYENI